MATHSSVLAWRIPTDRGAWWDTVHGVVKSQTHPGTHTRKGGDGKTSPFGRECEKPPRLRPGGQGEAEGSRSQGSSRRQHGDLMAVASCPH